MHKFFSQNGKDYPSVITGQDEKQDPVPEHITRNINTNSPMAIDTDTLMCNSYVS